MIGVMIHEKTIYLFIVARVVSFRFFASAADDIE
jgi:hypothetical protein